MKIAIADGFFKSLNKCFRPWWHPKELWYKFKCWAWHRYSTVKPRYLPHTWVDRTALLPHVIFEVISDFRDNECGEGCFVDWYADSGHKVTVNGVEKFVRDEIEDIYNWWHTTYMKEYEAREDVIFDEIAKIREENLTSEFQDAGDGMCLWNPQYDSEEAAQRIKELYQASRDLDELRERELKEYMHRAVEIYRSLWT